MPRIAALLTLVLLVAPAHGGSFTWSPIAGTGETTDPASTRPPVPFAASDGLLELTYNGPDQIGGAALLLPAEGLQAGGRGLVDAAVTPDGVTFNVAAGYYPGRIILTVLGATDPLEPDLGSLPVDVTVVAPGKGMGGFSFTGSSDPPLGPHLVGSVPEPPGWVLLSPALLLLGAWVVGKSRTTGTA